MVDKEKEKTEIEKFEYLKNEKSFLDEIKNIFIVFEGLSFHEKSKFDKKWWTQVLSDHINQKKTFYKLKFNCSVETGKLQP